MDVLRVGKVSATNYDEGKIRVVYSDRDDATTVELPLVVFNNEYYVPKVDDQVLVLHQPNGAASAFVLGDFWSKTHKTHKDTGEGHRVKYFDRDGKCYYTYEDSEYGDGKGDFEFHNDDKIKINNDDDFEQKCKGKIDISNEDDYKVHSDGKMSIDNDDDFQLQSDGKIDVSSQDDCSVQTSSNMSQKASGNFTVEADGSVTIKGATINIEGTLIINGIPYVAHIHGNGNMGSPTTGVITTE